MGLLGRAFLAFSHDVTAGAEPDWTEWHDREHIPERLSIDGFLRLRRYVAVEPGPRFFYFYEVRDLAVLQSAPYLERLGNPTPWTKRCMQYVINNKRTACRVTTTLGRGLGGSLGAIETGPSPGGDDLLRQRLVEAILPEALSKPGVVGAHLGEPDPDATTVRTDEKKLLQTPDAMARWLVLLDGVDQGAVTSALAEVLSDRALRTAGVVGSIHRAIYRLSFVMAQQD